MMSISDCLAARLGDGNSKVLAQALEVRGAWAGAGRCLLLPCGG